MYSRFCRSLRARWPRSQWRREVTEIVSVGQMRDLEFVATAPGDWAFHCHMLMHMHAGMFNVVTVRPMDGAAR